MMRRSVTFACGSDMLVGTLDLAAGSTGLLIVTGGNEVRSGAFGGQAKLAARIAAAGHPVFRFDRRGVGDSEGENIGFRNSGNDIAAALEAFRSLAPNLERVVAFGNCDAAAALMLTSGAGTDGLALSNPWTIETETPDTPTAPPPPAVLRARYLRKLTNPREIMRLLKGGVDLTKLAKGLSHALRPPPPSSGLVQDMAAGLAAFTGPVAILLATADRTAQLFEAAWHPSDPRIRRCQGAGHAYAEPAHMAWLEAQLLQCLRKP